MSGKKFRLFGGPNGSGKSLLINQISHLYDIGYCINADGIEAELKRKGFVDCVRYFPGILTQADWARFTRTSLADSRFESVSLEGISIKENFLVAGGGINSYHAAIIAEFFRELLLFQEATFSFETVMSHPSKVEFLEKASRQGFKTYLYFVCTPDPIVNVQRVQNRVAEGGHGVLPSKIEERYFKSLDLLPAAFSKADRAFIIDSQENHQRVILEKNRGEVSILSEDIPEWIVSRLLDKLDRPGTLG